MALKYGGSTEELIAREGVAGGGKFARSDLIHRGSQGTWQNIVSVSSKRVLVDTEGANF